MSDKVDELRKQLKDARNEQPDGTASREDSSATRITNSNSERHTSNESDANGYRLQSFSGSSDGTLGAFRTTNNPERKSPDESGSASSSNQRKRSPIGRPRKDYGQSRSDGTDVSTGSRSRSIRSIGNLTADDEIPPRTFDTEPETNSAPKATGEKPTPQGNAPARKRGRPAKQTTLRIVQPTTETREPKFSFGKTLSKSETKELTEPLIAAIQDEFAILDKIIWSYTGDELKQPIWGDVTEKEVSALTGLMLGLGEKSPAMATVVRGAVNAQDYVVVGTMLAPRFMETVKVVKQARQQKRAEKKERTPNEIVSRRERVRDIKRRARGLAEPNL